MARIPYDAETIGGKEAAELVDAIIKAKAAAIRVKARLNVNTVDGAATTSIAEGGANASMYGCASGEGGNFYNAFLHATTGIITKLDAIGDEVLAQVDMG